MFNAFVIACATTIASEVNWDTCIRFNDSWGPYKTEENCIIRSKQMYNEITEKRLKDITMLYFENSEGLIAVSFCEKLTEEYI